MTPRIAIPVAGMVLVAGCAGGGRPPAAGSPTPSPRVSSAAPRDPACASLYARLQQMTAVLNASAELIAGSVNKTELGRRIAGERRQLSRAADLMARKPIPARLRDADRRLVAALRVLTADFGRAAAPAARGDFQAAVTAMRDDATVRRIIAASKSIEDTCA